MNDTIDRGDATALLSGLTPQRYSALTGPERRWVADRLRYYLRRIDRSNVQSDNSDTYWAVRRSYQETALNTARVPGLIFAIAFAIAWKGSLVLVLSVSPLLVVGGCGFALGLWRYYAFSAYLKSPEGILVAGQSEERATAPPQAAFRQTAAPAVKTSHDAIGARIVSRRDSTSAYSALWMTTGWLVASTVLAIVASIIGVERDLAWIVVPSISSVALGAAMLVWILAWFRTLGRTPSVEFATWWGRRGRWMLVGTSIPVWVGFAIAIHHRTT